MTDRPAPPSAADAPARAPSDGVVAALLALLAGLLVVPWLPREILLNGDDALYGAIARGMAEGGPWLFPRWGAVPFMDKPPLLLWATAGAFELLGVSDVTARLFPALCGAGVVAVVYTLGGELGLDRRGRLLAALLLAGSVWHLHFSRRLLADMPMNLCLLGAATAWLRGRHRPGWTWVAGGLLGLALMLKGLATAPFVLTLAIHGLWMAGGWRGGLGRLVRVGGAALGVALPWHLAAWIWERREFIDTYIGYQVMAKLGQDVDRAGRPSWYYLSEVWAADPVLALLGAGALVWAGWRLSGRASPAGADERHGGWALLITWILVTWGVFSAATVKHTTYVLPSLAPICLLIAAAVGSLRAPWPAVALGLATLLGAANTLRVSVTSSYWEEGIVAMGMTVARSPDLAALGEHAAETPAETEILALDLYPMAPAFYSGHTTRWLITHRGLYDALKENPVLGRSGVAVHAEPRDLPTFFAAHPGDLVMVATGRPLPPGLVLLEQRPHFSLFQIP